jgi:hypothetical protein
MRVGVGAPGKAMAAVRSAAATALYATCCCSVPCLASHLPVPPCACGVTSPPPHPAAIKVCGPGVPIKSIGAAIQAVGDRHKYGVVKVFVGHGVGKVFHAWPHVAHHRCVPVCGSGWGREGMLAGQTGMAQLWAGPG